jgi:hypothetical protein
VSLPELGQQREQRDTGRNLFAGVNTDRRQAIVCRRMDFDRALRLRFRDLLLQLQDAAKTIAWDVVNQFTRPVWASAPNEAELRVDLYYN